MPKFKPLVQADGFAHTLFRLDHADLPAAVEEVKALWKRVLPEIRIMGRALPRREILPRNIRDRAARWPCHGMDECRCHCDLLHGAFLA